MKPTAPLCLALLLSTSFAFADKPQRKAKVESEIIELSYLPYCTKVERRGGRTWCLYSLADFRDKVAPVDLELQECSELKENLEAQSAELLTQRRLLREQLDLEVGRRKLYEERSRDLTKDLIAKDKELQKERSKPGWGSSIAWTISVMSVSVLVGYFVNDQF